MASKSSLREQAMLGLYQYYIRKEDIRGLLEDITGKPFAEINPFILDSIIECLENEKEYVTSIEANLQEWTFDRLGYIERAILVLGTHEIVSGKTPKAVVINECVNLAKKYCDDDSYKLINGVLDKLASHE